MQVVFFGSSEFSIVVLNKVLSAQCSVLGVITTPDKPTGRHLKLTPNPVKVFAQKNNIPVYDSITPLPPLKLRGGTEEGDIGLVAAYGKIIPQSVIDAFNGQIYNIHPSLLPKYRGPSPLQQQILDGLTETGVTIIQLDALMDHGPIVAQEKSQITPTDTTVTLGVKLFSLGADLFLKANLESSMAQDDNEATFTKKLTRQDGFIPWDKFCQQLKTNDQSLNAKLRAFSPWPGVWTTTPSGQRLKLVALQPQILVQLEGKTPQSWPIVV